MGSNRSTSADGETNGHAPAASHFAAPREKVGFQRGRIRVDSRARVLVVEGRTVKLSARAFDLLEALIERGGRLVTKQELLDAVWPGLVVEENNLHVHVMSLRKALGAYAIVTVSGRGYRFTLREDEDDAEPSRGDRRDVALLIGRETLSDDICALVRKPETRLVTLRGPGGSGKTRLASSLAGTLAPAFADGSHMVMLAPVRDAAHVPAAIASVLNVREAGSRPVLDELIAFLARRSSLLVLDNFEHVSAAAATVERMLDACPRLKIVATSRTSLKLGSEMSVDVPPLALPAVGEERTVALSSPAVRLFLARARQTGYPVGSNAQEHDAAIEVCRRLDGLPLAIELAAARLRVLSAGELAARLVKRLDLLKSYGKDLPDRQKTLRAAIAWSYDLLDDAAKALFCRLSVFVDGWSLKAAERVAGDASLGEPVVDLLTTLLDHHLVQRNGDVLGEPCFAMLETVREFAFGELERSAEAAEIRTRHAVYYASLAESLEARLRSGSRTRAVARLRAENNNLRAALSWTVVESPNAHLAARLVGALPWFWYFTAQFSEGRAWIRRALALDLPDRQAQAKALSGEARLAMYSGRVDQGIDLAREAVDLFRASADRTGLALALMHLATALSMARHFALAFPLYEEAETLFRALRDEWGTAFAQIYHGSGLTLTGTDDARAEMMISEGRARFRALGDQWAMTTSSHYLGSLALRRGDLSAARALTHEMLTNARELGDNYRVSRNLHQLAEIDLAADKLEDAERQIEASIALTHEQGREGDLSLQLRLYARIVAARRRPERAVRLCAAAARLKSENVTIPNDDPAAHEATLARLRESLGEKAFQAEWLMGAVMPVDDLLFPANVAASA